MKQPKIENLKLDKKVTKSIRSKSKKQKSIKITINIDAETLLEIKKLSQESSIPYQRLLNNLLKDSLEQHTTVESRLLKLEKEVKKLKSLA